MQPVVQAPWRLFGTWQAAPERVLDEPTGLPRPREAWRPRPRGALASTPVCAETVGDMRAAWALGLLTSCTVSVSIEGKRCAPTEPRCLGGYVCVDDVCVAAPPDGSAEDAGTADAGTADAGTADAGTADAGTPDAGPTACPLDVDPAENACLGTTWYLSPTGDDAFDGRSPGQARLTIPAAARRGDTVHLLGGVYPRAPALAVGMSGSAACPFVVEGEPDGGSVLQDTLELGGSYVVFRDLVFSPLDTNGVEVTSFASHITFQRCTFRSRPPTQGYPVELNLHNGCDDCVVRESSFESPDGVAPINAGGPRFAFRGNRVRSGAAAGPAFYGAAPVVEGNDFSGIWLETPHLDFTGSTDARLSRNVFHDLVAVFSDKRLIGGPVRVSHNTFSNIAGNAVPLVAGVSRFDNNLVTIAEWVVGGPGPDAGDWNVFDPSVRRPYADWDGGALKGSDRIAQVNLDPDGVPLAGSAAIDSADPSHAVPPGGGLRADVGARERGATRLPDGRYCLTDGGF